MSKLSVVLATHNEERNIKKCLDGIESLADEIVIVDGSSDDKTVQIAKQFGARIKITTNKQNFHINKQLAIDMAQKDWILQLDADEIVPEDLRKEVRSVIDTKKTDVNGYWIPRKNWFLGRFLMKGGQYPDYTIRLYKNGKGKLPQKDVHEQAVVEGKKGYLKNALYHYPYKDFGEYFKKWNRYTDLMAVQYKERSESKNIFQKIFDATGFMFFKPSHWFITTYIRHKGFMDLWPGFVFCLFSSLRFPVSYIKYLLL